MSKRETPLNDQIIINKKNVYSLHEGYKQLEKRISEQGTTIQHLQATVSQQQRELTTIKQQLLVALAQGHR